MLLLRPPTGTRCMQAQSDASWWRLMLVHSSHHLLLVPMRSGREETESGIAQIEINSRPLAEYYAASVAR
jgi:hypothetical protein